MNLYFRFFFLVLKRALYSKEQSVLAPCETKFIVWPTDLDLNFHMNNGVFFSLMDLNRFDLMLKTKSFFRFFLSGYYPVVLSESTYFNKSLTLFNGFAIESQIRDWDDNFFYFTSTFKKNSEVIATSTVRTGFKKRGKKGLVKTQDILNFFGQKLERPPKTEISNHQVSLDESMFDRSTKSVRR